MNLIEELESNRILMKNNMLVKARYSLSLIENRVFLSMLYKLQKKSDGVLTCSISHSEFKDIIKFKQKNTVKGILEVLEDLRKKPIYFKEEKKNKKGNLWGAYGFINGYEYDDELGIFNIEASEKIHNLLKEYLKMGYTPVNVQIWLSLNNSYAQRFYDLLRLWSGTKDTINYKLDEIKELLMLEDKYSKYNDFKRRVILPAIKELNETGYFEIDIKENKVGRKVDSIDFYIKDLDKRKYFTKDEIIKEIPGIELEEVAITCDENSCENKEEIILNDKVIIEPEIISDTKENKMEIFIPDESIFTKGTLRRVKMDFKDIDFKNKYMEKAFEDAVMITLDKDDVETIKATSYKFFKGTLDNKIVEYKLEEKEDIDHKREMDMFW
ncbi:MAG: replication initiation protein [Paraclostridium bifermentans]|uniref:replication initiation protein n=1 Tax=Paraclostridium bifermentans TaxID=1490 RepID=UPI0011DCC7B9|nr:replication initiation protein [Paraclostridium bifermentans]MBS5954541.1 replication initiation protein [Paraclostridium bifermentans]MBS6509253.1 replication initiation protein [Paraclostridium bifermentans]MBU5289646.1 replication initiation protein [Paraclostridium bifermentans]MDU3803455.1 replication initiation protein [Paraclostridium bifermentans]